MQSNLFGEIELKDELTIEQASKNANVSTATIRNWIKTGYLTISSKGTITQKSYDSFMANIAGKEKLNLRANKSLKESHLTHKGEINVLIRNFKGENIGIEYENSLSNAYRNKEGIYYTPSWVVKDMFKNIKIDTNFNFLDPCCGSGNFVMEALKLGILPENIYAFDVDENAIFITKERIKQEFGFETPNIKVGNFLEEVFKFNQENIFFDVIFTNPPWGKKIQKEEKEKIASFFGCGNSLDTTALFMGASVTLLKENGFLGFLVQDAFFNISTFEDIRKKMIAKKIIRFIDYGKAFKGLLTKAQTIIIQNTEANQEDIIECETNNKIFYRNLASFTKNPKLIFNFWVNENEAKIIQKLYTTKHITLKNNAKWALGIVTGNNDRFCINIQKQNYIPIYKGSDITKKGLKKPTTFLLNDFSNFQQVAPLEMYEAKEKLIYKFISSDLCFFCDNEQKYILNSANLVIPFDFEITNQQLVALLNSEIMNWLFKKMFATHKVLRSDLELLPIHSDYFLNYNDFSETNYLNYLQITKNEDNLYQYKLKDDNLEEAIKKASKRN